MSTELETRRAEAVDELARLRVERGSALLDNSQFDSSRIDALENEIDAISHAEAEAVRRERAAEAERLEALRRTLAAELQEKEQARLACLAEAEQAARKLVASLKDVLQLASAERYCIVRMGVGVPSELFEEELTRRVGERLGAQLSELRPYPPRLGQSVTWRSTPSWVPASESWVDAELKALGNKISNLTKE